MEKQASTMNCWLVFFMEDRNCIGFFHCYLGKIILPFMVFPLSSAVFLSIFAL